MRIDPTYSTILERYASVLYPFPIEGVLDALPARGWIVPFTDRDESGIKLSGAPSKGNLKLAFDLSLRTFGVRGIDPDEMLAEFVSLSAFVTDKFGLAPEVRSYYTEFRFVGTVDVGSASGMSVPEQLGRWWSGHDRSEELAREMANWLPGEPLGAFGIRMATRGRDANRPDWTELVLAPMATSGNRFYQFELLYRHTDRTFVESVARSARALIAGAIEEIDR